MIEPPGDPSPWHKVVTDVWQSTTLTLVIAGAAGGFIRWITLRSGLVEGLVGVVVGMICAVYMGPLVIKMIEPMTGPIPLDTDGARLTSFAIGLGGISLTRTFMDKLGVSASQPDPAKDKEAPPNEARDEGSA